MLLPDNNKCCGIVFIKKKNKTNTTVMLNLGFQNCLAFSFIVTYSHMWDPLMLREQENSFLNKFVSKSGFYKLFWTYWEKL